MKKVLLAIGAHPDDIDFGASGTVAKLVSEGCDAYYVICTDGSKGSHNPKMTSEELVRIRKKEQRAAGKVLGLKDVSFLEHCDTELLADLQFKEELVRIIRTRRPNLVIGLDPTFYFSMEPYFGKEYHFVNHTDHRAAAVATMDAVFPMARDRLTFPLHEQEGLEPHRVEELWIVNWACKTPEHLVDITDTLKTKLLALKQHTSQFDDYEDLVERVTNRAKVHAEKESFEHAESFIRLKMS